MSGCARPPPDTARPASPCDRARAGRTGSSRLLPAVAAERGAAAACRSAAPACGRSGRRAGPGRRQRLSAEARSSVPGRSHHTSHAPHLPRSAPAGRRRTAPDRCRARPAATGPPVPGDGPAAVTHRRLPGPAGNGGGRDRADGGGGRDLRGEAGVAVRGRVERVPRGVSGPTRLDGSIVAEHGHSGAPEASRESMNTAATCSDTSVCMDPGLRGRGPGMTADRAAAERAPLSPPAPPPESLRRNPPAPYVGSGAGAPP